MKRSRPAQTERLLPLFPSLFDGERGIGNKIIIDLFAGGGGVSEGIRQALGRGPDIAVNHDREAIEMHKINHPDTFHVHDDVFHANFRALIGDRQVAALWASPDCTHHSPARGGKPIQRHIRSLAWVVCKVVGQLPDHQKPDVIMLENVPAFRSWNNLVARRAPPTDPRTKKVLWPNKPKRRRARGTVAQRPPRGPIQYDERGQMQLTADRRPRTQGRIFKAFVRHLKCLGYTVEWRDLVASEYGAPTSRTRFFMVARRDGLAIRWPTVTHGDPRSEAVQRGELLPWRTALECLDLNLPTFSIFGRQEKAPGQRARHGQRPPRPQGRGPLSGQRYALAEKSLTRIAVGLERQVLTRPDPVVVHSIVQLAHGGHNSRALGADQPLYTVTGSGSGLALASPFMVPMSFGNTAYPADQPSQTITTQSNKLTLALGYCSPRYGTFPAHAPRSRALDRPTSAITSRANGTDLVLGFITEYRRHSCGAALDGLLHTVTAGGGHHALAKIHVRALAGPALGFLAPNYGGHNANYSTALTQPTGTILASGGRLFFVSARVALLGTSPRRALFLTTYYGAKTGLDGRSQALDDTLRTQGTGNRFWLTSLYLQQYNGCGDSQALDHTLRTATSKARFSLTTVQLQGVMNTPDAGPATLDVNVLRGARQVYAFLERYNPAALDRLPVHDRAERLVTVQMNGTTFVVYDIGCRMLVPRELFRANGFPDHYVIEPIIGGKPLSVDAQIAKCGNAVPPNFVTALFTANYPKKAREAAD